MKNDPNIFMSSTDIIRFSVKWHSVLGYHDDIVVSLKTVKQQLNHIQNVVTLIQIYNMTFELQSLSFITEIINHQCQVK